MHNTQSESEAKRILFEVYSAGFEAGYSQKIDIASAYKQFWDNLLKQMKEHI